MPLFRRHDADPVTDESPLRTIMPYVLRSRSQSAIYHEEVYDLSATGPWLRTFNRADRSRTATLFHLVLYATGRAMLEYPHLNRFVCGRRLYQHRDVQLTFAAKLAMTPESPVAMLKFRLDPQGSFDDFVARTARGVRDLRDDTRPAHRDKLDLLLRLPGWLISSSAGLWRLADHWNLLPATWLDDDPMYTSACFTNLGSVGMNDTYHHLNDYGTASIFAAVGKPRPGLFVGPEGAPVMRPSLQVCWTADERVADGYYTARTLARIRQIIEDPAHRVGAAPERSATAAPRATAPAGPPGP